MATSLAAALSLLLPRELRFHIHHVVSPTITCDPLFAPPPGAKPDETTQELHIFSVSIDHKGALLHILALEAIIYETSSLTTLFVSKADSTGYAYLQEGKHSSTTKTTVCEFLHHLVNSRKRAGVKFVVSLFARAQDQYLFPGSIENHQKHVLDDRHLIRWWCSILDIILKSSVSSTAPAPDAQHSAQGFLKVPGCDEREVRSFFPKDKSIDTSLLWTHGDPLKVLQAVPDLPERCLIPRFPDDPKARFAIDLDDELPESQAAEKSVANEKKNEQAQENGNLPVPKNPPTAEYSPPQPEPPKPQSDGKWRSVRSLDRFWELMGYRQECAAGRLVGFIWGVMDTTQSLATKIPSEASSAVKRSGMPLQDAPHYTTSHDGLASPPLSSQVQPENSIQDAKATPKTSLEAIEEPVLNPITPASSQVPPTPGQPPQPQNNANPSRSDEIFLLLPAYNTLSNVLQTGDYSTLSLAEATTAKWVETLESELRIFGGEEAVARSRVPIVGLNDTLPVNTNGTGTNQNGVFGEGAGAKRQREGEGEVKMLAGGLVRKKRKA